MKVTASKYFATFALIFLANIFIGCSNVRPPTSSVGETVRIEDKNYTLNVAKAAFVGETMLKRRDYYAQHVSRKDFVSATQSGEISCKLVFLNPFVAKFTADKLIKIEGEIEVDGLY